VRLIDGAEDLATWSGDKKGPSNPRPEHNARFMASHLPDPRRAQDRHRLPRLGFCFRAERDSHLRLPLEVQRDEGERLGLPTGDVVGLGSGFERHRPNQLSAYAKARCIAERWWSEPSMLLLRPSVQG